MNLPIQLAAAFGAVTVALNVYAVASALAGRPPIGAGIVLALAAVGTLGCFTLAVLRMRRSLSARNGHLDPIARIRRDQQALRQAVPRGPWIALFGWAAACFYAQATVPSLQTGPPVLGMTSVLGAFAFVAWALLRFDAEENDGP